MWALRWHLCRRCRSRRFFVNQLDDGHRSRVTMTLAGEDDSRVTAGPVRIARYVGAEQPVADLAVSDPAVDIAPRCHVIGLGGGDHTLNPAAQLFGLGFSCRNASMTKQRRDLIARQSLPVGGAASELASGFAMAHGALA